MFKHYAMLFAILSFTSIATIAFGLKSDITCDFLCNGVLPEKIEFKHVGDC